MDFGRNNPVSVTDALPPCRVRSMAYHEERSTVWKVIAVAVLAFAAWFVMRGDSYVKESQMRVKLVLEGMQKGSDIDGWGQQATTYYAKGVKSLPTMQDTEAAMKDYKAWRQEKDLWGHQIATYSVDGAEVIKDSDPKSAVVEVTIEGKPYAIRTTRGQPLVWDH
jgi:hypothetical protein